LSSAGANDRVKSAGITAADGLSAKDRYGDRNRDRGELRIAHDLVDGAIGRGGVRAEAVDEPQQHQLGDRHHHHPDRARNSDAQDFA
jgi:hypothetical protein